MHRQGGRVDRWLDWQRSSLVALVFVLVAVGHDVLMAADAQAALPTHHRAITVDRDHVTVSFDGNPRLDGWSVGSGCGIGQAVVRRGDDLVPDAGTAIPRDLPLLADRPASVGDPTEPPTLPPRTRRALLQIYRI